MRAAWWLSGALLATGCTSSDALLMQGLDHGSRYLWAKDGAGEMERRRAMVLCAEPGQKRLEGAHALAVVPVVGLLGLPAAVSAEQEVLDQRVACMEADGWRLVEVVSGQPQRVMHSLGMARITPAVAR